MTNIELKLLWPFYVTAFSSSSFSVAIPVWVIFFQKQFSFVQISFALSLQSLAAILFEVPTGVMADLYGRKVSVVLGIALQGALWVALPFIHLEMVLYPAFFLMGILRTLESGADKAWMIDWLKDNHQDGFTQEMFIKIQGLHSVGCVISSLMATALLFILDIRSLFLIQGSGYILESIVLCFFAKENVHNEKRRRMKMIIRNAVDTTRKGVGLLLMSKPLLYLVLATTLGVCSRDFGCIAWQPVLVDLSLPPEKLGIVFSVAGLTGIIAPFLTKKLLKQFGREEHFLACTTFLEFIFLASLSFVNRPFFILGVTVYSLAMLVSDLQSPVAIMYFQSFVPSRIRATVLSVQSTIFAIFSFVISNIGGYAMDSKGPKTALIYFAFFLFPAGILYLLTGRTVPNAQHQTVVSIFASPLAALFSCQPALLCRPQCLPRPARSLGHFKIFGPVALRGLFCQRKERDRHRFRFPRDLGIKGFVQS